MKKALSALRWYVLNMGGYLFRTARRGVPRDKIAYFDLGQNVYHRYLLIFMEMLRGRGYGILLRHRYGCIARWDTSLLVRQFPELRIVNGPPAKADLVFTDRPGMDGIRIDPDYFSKETAADGTYWMPMPMSHGIYANGLDKWIPGPGEVPATRTLFFAGNVDPGQYNSPSLEALFKIFNRHHLLSLIEKHFPDRIASPRSSGELSDIRPGRDIILIDRHLYNIPESGLRTTLARHDLFLAAPGVVMPFCHNLTEAMSVGSIPVLQFAHLLTPPLEHGVNCFTFSNEKELVELLEEFPHMSEGKIRQMRANVLEHYLKHLSPDAVIPKLESGSVKTLKLQGEANSVALIR